MHAEFNRARVAGLPSKIGFATGSSIGFWHTKLHWRALDLLFCTQQTVYFCPCIPAQAAKIQTLGMDDFQCLDLLDLWSMVDWAIFENSARRQAESICIVWNTKRKQQAPNLQWLQSSACLLKTTKTIVSTGVTAVASLQAVGAYYLSRGCSRLLSTECCFRFSLTCLCSLAISRWQ